MIRRPPRSTLFPYTPLSQSHPRRPVHGRDAGQRRPGDRPADAVGQCSGDIRHGLHDREDRKSTRLNSSHLVISYAVFCLKKKKKNKCKNVTSSTNKQYSSEV